MLNVFICLLLGISLLFVGIFFKIIDNGAAVVFALLLTITRLVFDATCFYVLLGCLFAIIIARFLLKKFLFTAYEKLLNDKYALDNAISSFGLSFCLLAVLVLCIEFFPYASNDFNFCRIAFFVSLGASVSIELSRICNGFAKTGVAISNSKKTSPLNSGAITVYGAVISFVASFSFGLVYYFKDRKTIPAIICVLLSFIAYLVYSFFVEKFEYRQITITKQIDVQAEGGEIQQSVEEEVKTIGIQGFNQSAINFICLLIIVTISIIIGYILK